VEQSETILVVTNFLEGPSVMLHANYQARLYGAKILPIHVIRLAALRADSGPCIPSTLPRPALRVVQAAPRNMAKAFPRRGILCETIVLRSLLGSPPNSIVSRSLGGTVIHRIVSEANCPAMTDKPGDMSVQAANPDKFSRNQSCPKLKVLL